ncbi:MAG: PKD domain-containing protein [Halorhabdus sp.]
MTDEDEWVQDDNEDPKLRQSIRLSKDSIDIDREEFIYESERDYVPRYNYHSFPGRAGKLPWVAGIKTSPEIAAWTQRDGNKTDNAASLAISPVRDGNLFRFTNVSRDKATGMDGLVQTLSRLGRIDPDAQADYGAIIRERRRQRDFVQDFQTTLILVKDITLLALGFVSGGLGTLALSAADTLIQLAIDVIGCVFSGDTNQIVYNQGFKQNLPGADTWTGPISGTSALVHVYSAPHEQGTVKLKSSLVAANENGTSRRIKFVDNSHTTQWTIRVSDPRDNSQGAWIEETNFKGKANGMYRPASTGPDGPKPSFTIPELLQLSNDSSPPENDSYQPIFEEKDTVLGSAMVETPDAIGSYEWKIYDLSPEDVLNPDGEWYQDPDLATDLPTENEYDSGTGKRFEPDFRTRNTDASGGASAWTGLQRVALTVTDVDGNSGTTFRDIRVNEPAVEIIEPETFEIGSEVTYRVATNLPDALVEGISWSPISGADIVDGKNDGDRPNDEREITVVFDEIPEKAVIEATVHTIDGATGSATVKIDEPLSVSITKTSTDRGSEEQITFTAHVSGNESPVSYDWSGDVSGTGQSITQTFTEQTRPTRGVDQFQATVKVQETGDDGDQTSATLPFWPSTDFAVDLSAAPTEASTGESVTLTASVSGDSGTIKYSWTGASGSGNQITESWDSPGEYEVTVTADNGTDTVSDTVTIEVTEPLSVSIDTRRDDKGSYVEITFIANVSGSDGRVAYTWSGDVSGSARSITRTFGERTRPNSGADLLNATVKVRNDGETDSATIEFWP